MPRKFRLNRAEPGTLFPLCCCGVLWCAAGRCWLVLAWVAVRCLVVGRLGRLGLVIGCKMV